MDTLGAWGEPRPMGSLSTGSLWGEHHGTLLVLMFSQATVSPLHAPFGEVGERAVLLWESNSEKEGLQLELTIPGKCLLEP